LVPVGMHDVAMANRAQHAAITGRAAWREIKVRNWLRYRTGTGQALWFNRAGNQVFNPSLPTAAQPIPAAFRGAFVIDPLFMASYSGAGGDRCNWFPFPSSADSV